jgi:hypothetical protein
MYDFDLARVTGANKLRKRSAPDKFWLKVYLNQRMTINGKIKVIDKDISDFS